MEPLFSEGSELGFRVTYDRAGIGRRGRGIALDFEGWKCMREKDKMHMLATMIEPVYVRHRRNYGSRAFASVHRGNRQGLGTREAKPHDRGEINL